MPDYCIALTQRTYLGRVGVTARIFCKLYIQRRTLTAFEGCSLLLPFSKKVVYRLHFHLHPFFDKRAAEQHSSKTACQLLWPCN